MAELIGASEQSGVPGVRGDSTQFNGVLGVSTASGHAGVAGVNESGGNGLFGRGSGNGVFGIHVGADGSGVVGTSDQNDGVRGFSAAKDHSGVVGTNTGGGVGVLGQSTQGPGVVGNSENSRGIQGHSINEHGVFGQSTQGAGVVGISENFNGIEGRSTNHIGVFGKGGRLAGFFEGDVEVTGDIRLANADCAEDFNIAGHEQVQPGTVMVLGNEGTLQPSERAYDKRVAGVISGAGDYKPGIVLDKQLAEGNRQPIALLGKVYCKVDASYAPIEAGDLLTTSPTPGYAMKASDPFKAFGTVIGKALRDLNEGQALIPILIALQ